MFMLGRPSHRPPRRSNNGGVVRKQTGLCRDCRVESEEGNSDLLDIVRLLPACFVSCSPTLSSMTLFEYLMGSEYLIGPQAQAQLLLTVQVIET